MQAYKLNSIKEKWASFSSREQRYLKIGAIVIGIAFIYFLIWSPLTQNVAHLHELIYSRTELLTWMQHANKEIKTLSHSKIERKKSLSPIELLSVLQRVIAKNGLNEQVTQLKQNSKDAIEVHFKKADFDKILTMLTMLSREEALSISQVTVKREASVGMVNADIIFAIG